MNKYLELDLESVAIPGSYMDTVLKDGEWICDGLDANYSNTFELYITELTRGICYAVDLLPFDDGSEDMEVLNGVLENKGVEANGYGWEEYFCKFIEERYFEFRSKVGTDSESDTCGIYVMDSFDDYKQLLFIISEAIKDLLDN